jgi:hypothetical protein
VRGTPISIEWHDELEGHLHAEVAPRNTRTCDGAELLRVGIGGSDGEIRLERIERWEPAPPGDRSAVALLRADVLFQPLLDAVGVADARHLAA